MLEDDSCDSTRGKSRRMLKALYYSTRTWGSGMEVDGTLVAEKFS